MVLIQMTKDSSQTSSQQERRRCSRERGENAISNSVSPQHHNAPFHPNAPPRRRYNLLRSLTIALVLSALCVYLRWKSSSIVSSSSSSSLLMESNPSVEQTCTLVNDYPPATGRDYTLVVTVPDGYVDFFINWWWHYQHNLLYPELSQQQTSTASYHVNRTVVVIAADAAAHTQIQTWWNQKQKQLVALQQPLPRVVVEQCSLNIASRLLPHVNKGNIVYTDIDVLWLRDPFPYLYSLMDKHNDNPQTLPDLYMAVDQEHFRGYHPYYCADFMIWHSNNRTVALLERWRDLLNRPRSDQPSHLREFLPSSTQPALNQVLHYAERHHVRRQVLHPLDATLTHQSLPTRFFPNGRQYFTEFTPTQQKEAIIAHNNFILGRDAMKARFQKFGLWNVNHDEDPNKNT
jgi:hypothetical protein